MTARQSPSIQGHPLGTPRLQNLRYGKGNPRTRGQHQSKPMGVTAAIQGIVQFQEIGPFGRQLEIEPLPTSHAGQFGTGRIGQRQVRHQSRIQLTGFHTDAQSLTCLTLKPEPEHFLRSHASIDHGLQW